MISKQQQECIELLGKSHFNRRTLLKGLGLFLGLPVFSSLVGCQTKGSKLPKELKSNYDEIDSIQRLWQPPVAVKELGQTSFKTVGHINQHIKTCLEALAQEAKTQNNSSITNEKDQAKHLAKILKKLHLKATQAGSWVDVRGWRLSQVEVAAYALCSLDLSED